MKLSEDHRPIYNKENLYRSANDIATAWFAYKIVCYN